VLAGRALRLGAPIPRAQVTAVILGERSIIRDIGLAWVDGRFEWGHLWAEADENGRFAFAGLGGHERHLWVSDVPAKTGSLGQSHEYTLARAPQADLALELDASLVTLGRTPDSPPELTGEIRVTCSDAETAAGRARGGDESGTFTFRRASDPLPNTFLAPPHTPLSLSIEIEGLAPIPLEIVTPGPGEELVRTLDFRAPPVQAPEVRATLELEWLRDPRLALDALRVDGRGFGGSFALDELVDGVVRIEDLAPGRHRVRVHAGWDHLSETHAFDRVLEVELAPGETRRERFSFELGGRLAVDVRAASGERRRARFRLLDADGTRVEEPFHARDAEGDRWDEAGLFLHPYTHTSPTLPAGDYVLVLWDDDVAEERHPVRLVAGETTALAVTLHPR
jgi:hypothetical protein